MLLVVFVKIFPIAATDRLSPVLAKTTDLFATGYRPLFYAVCVFAAKTPVCPSGPQPIGKKVVL